MLAHEAMTEFRAMQAHLVQWVRLAQLEHLALGDVKENVVNSATKVQLGHKAHKENMADLVLREHLVQMEILEWMVFLVLKV
jgi:hypothetical protein